MRTKQQLWAEVERVPVLTGRVARGDVEGLEVVPLGLDLWAELDLVAERLEHGLDLPAHLGQDVDVASAEWRTGKGDVGRFGLGKVCEPQLFELGSTRGQRRLDRALGFVRRPAELRLFGCRQLSDRRQEPAD